MPASLDDSVLALDRQLIQVVYRSRSLIEGAVDERRFLDLAEHALHAEDAAMSAVRDFLCFGRWGHTPG